MNLSETEPLLNRYASNWRISQLLFGSLSKISMLNTAFRIYSLFLSIGFYTIVDKYTILLIN